MGHVPGRYGRYCTWLSHICDTEIDTKHVGYLATESYILFPSTRHSGIAGNIVWATISIALHHEYFMYVAHRKINIFSSSERAL